jgi:hypothetical protein
MGATAIAMLRCDGAMHGPSDVDEIAHDLTAVVDAQRERVPGL